MIENQQYSGSFTVSVDDDTDFIELFGLPVEVTVNDDEDHPLSGTYRMCP